MNRTNGYNSYRGRGSAVKIIAVVALVLVILGALAYLVMQNYMVYDDDGTVHLELPFLKKKEDTPPPVEDGDLQIDVITPQPDTPDRGALPALHGQLLAPGVLSLPPKEVLSGVEEAMAIEVKTDNGAITYTTEAQVPQEIYVEQGDTMANLKALLKSDRYAIARMSVFCDSYFVRAYHDAALRLSGGGLWYDANGAAWLDPSNPQTLIYITTLCQEYAQLGFDEILLDNFCYPTNGRVSSLSGLEDTDRVQVLGDFVRSLRANLPEEMVLSIVVNSPLGEESGLTTQQLESEFDRLYVPAGTTGDALCDTLSEGLDSEGRLVRLVYRPLEEGSYLLLG